MNENDLVFQQSPLVEYASNYFLNVPIILQYDETPLIEVVREQAAGFTTQFKIYNQDGIYIAKVKGTQIYPTKEGTQSDIKLRHFDRVTACELEGKTLFEIRRKKAAALKTEAELYTPEGCFLKSNEYKMPSELIKSDKTALRIGGAVMVGNQFIDCRIGIHIKSDGSLGIGCS